MHRPISIILLLIATLCATPARSDDAAAPLAVAAAISLKDALPEVPKDSSADPGHTVRFSFGASGALGAQVKNGAPIDVFIAAAAKPMDELDSTSAIDRSTRR